ncbi:MAG: hypothetical protein HUU15_03090 [Candidatus Brocadiae bacterium]|nr:hypothetical protein [Candidatus Brocadiia bacterium]
MRTLALLILSLSLSPAFADPIVLKDGSTLEGTVLAQNEKYLRLKTDKEELCLWKEDLKEKTAWDLAIVEYREKAGAAGSDDADAHRTLAAWCRERGLSEECRAHLEEVLRISPADDAAATELGLVKGKDGTWTSERQAKEKQGLVRYLGEWMKKEEREKHEKGVVRIGKVWKGKADCAKAVAAEVARQAALADARDAEAAQKKWADRTAAADRAIKGELGNAYRADFVDGYIVRTDLAAADCKAFYRQIALYRRQFLTDFGRELGIRYDTPINIYLFSSRETYLSGVATLDPSSANFATRGSGFTDTNRGSIEESRIYLYKNDLDKPDPRSPLKWVQYTSTFYHEVFHFYLASLTRDRADNTIGIGLNEAFASYLEGSVFDAKAERFDWGKRNPDRLKGGRDGRRSVDAEQLIRMSTAQFNTSPAPQSVALYGVGENFVHFLINDQKGKYRSGLLKFIASYGQGGPGDPERDRVKRLEKFLGAPMAQLQKECDAYTATRKE